MRKLLLICGLLLLCSHSYAAKDKGYVTFDNLQAQYITGTPLPPGSSTYVNSPSTMTNISPYGEVVSSLTVNSGFFQSVNVKTVDYVMTSTDSVLIASNTSTNAVLTITLPTAANTGQTLTITDGGRSTQTVLVQAISGQLIGSTTDQFRMYAPGQSVELVADGSLNWVPKGPLPASPPWLGFPTDPNSATTMVSSTAYCWSVNSETFLGITGMRFNVNAIGQATQIGVYDSNGNVISTSTAAAFTGTGSASKSLVNVAYVAPGTVWMCVAAQSATTGLTRAAASTPMSGPYCAIAAKYPLPPSLTFPGCAPSGTVWSFMALVGGGVK